MTFFKLVNYISLFSFSLVTVFLFSSFSFSFSLTEGYFSVILQFQFQFQLTDETLALTVNSCINFIALKFQEIEIFNQTGIISTE